jgi:hypothetical protein
MRHSRRIGILTWPDIPDATPQPISNGSASFPVEAIDSPRC